MICGSDPDKPREIGKRYTGVWDLDGVFYPDQPCVVLREATFEEWLKQGWEHFGRAPEPHCDPREARFYQVSLD